MERSFEEFYEDVHTEFLKFGELVNFKVCRNGSHHLRGNAYVHYKSLESAMLAYHSINGRYFAGKQVSCEFVAVTRWKVAICGEYMKSKLKVCSRGSACNFIHCFRNPGGDYEWADWDKPPPRYWAEKMTALFGYSDQLEDERIWDPIRRLARDNERYHNQRSQLKQIENSNRTSRDPYDEDNIQRAKIQRTNIDKRRVEGLDRRESREETHYRHHHQPSKRKSYDSESDTDLFNRDRDTDILGSRTRKHSRYNRKKSYDSQETQSSGSHDDAVLGTASSKRRKKRHGEEHREKSSGRKVIMSGVMDNLEHKKRSSDSTTSSKGKTYEDRDPASIDDLWRRRSCDFDSTSVWSDGVRERSYECSRKSSRNLTEVSRISKDTESHEISNDNRESEQVNAEIFPVQKRSSSSRKESLSRKGVEVVSIDEHKRSDEEHVNRKSRQSDQQSESYDSDDSCGTVKTVSRKSKKDLPKKSKRKSDSDEKFVYDHTYEEGIHRDDNGINLDEDIDQRGRWESEHVDSEKEQKRGRKSRGKDDKHHIGSRSRHQSSDEYFEERRSRSSSKSSHRKHRNR